MSRAFIKESDAPEVLLGFYRAHRARSRFDFDVEIDFSSNDLLEVLHFLRHSVGGWHLRDGSGVLLLIC